MKKYLWVLLLLALVGAVAFFNLSAHEGHETDNTREASAIEPRTTMAPTPPPSSGTLGEGGAAWRFYSDGTVVVEAGFAEPTTSDWLGAISPWNNLRWQIRVIRFTGPIETRGSLESLFDGLAYLTAIEGLDYINISNVTNMRRMFANTGLVSLDLSGWDTRHVTNMRYMFERTYALQELKLGDNFSFGPNAGLSDQVRSTDPRYVTRWRSAGPEDGGALISSLTLMADYDANMAGTFVRIWHRRSTPNLPAPIESIFFDSRVAAEVAYRLGFHNALNNVVTAAQLAEITDLNLVPDSWRTQGSSVFSLEGMQHLTSLESLALTAYVSVDLSLLAALPQLECLTFSPLTHPDLDIAPLVQMASLRSFAWQSEYAISLSSIVRLQQLESLTFFSGGLTDISPLAEMTNLKALHISSTFGPYDWGWESSISDLTPLARLYNLEEFSINLQQIVLPRRHMAPTLVIENNIFAVDGTRVAPYIIDRDGTYSEPYFTWTNLSNTIGSVTFFFSEEVTVGNATATFSGVVTQPLVPPDTEITQWVSVSFTLPNPIGYVTVELRAGSASGEVVSALTDRVPFSGNVIPIGFTFHDVPPGTYSLIIRQPGHTSFTINNVVVIAGADVHLNRDPRFPFQLPLRPGNISGSGQVNIVDLNILLQNWMSDYTPADLTGSGQVNISDLNLLLRNWMAESVVID